jgi:hypothetical protein
MGFGIHRWGYWLGLGRSYILGRIIILGQMMRLSHGYPHFDPCSSFIGYGTQNQDSRLTLDLLGYSCHWRIEDLQGGNGR